MCIATHAGLRQVNIGMGYFLMEKVFFYSSVLFLKFLNLQVMFYVLLDQFSYFCGSFVAL